MGRWPVRENTFRRLTPQWDKCRRTQCEPLLGSTCCFFVHHYASSRFECGNEDHLSHDMSKAKLQKNTWFKSERITMSLLLPNLMPTNNATTINPYEVLVSPLWCPLPRLCAKKATEHRFVPKQQTFWLTGNGFSGRHLIRRKPSNPLGWLYWGLWRERLHEFTIS